MIKNPKLWMWISALTITVSIGITIIFPPVWGVDFIGGSLLEVEGNADKAREVQDSLTEKFSMPVTAQGTQDGTIIIRTPVLDDNAHKEVLTFLREKELMTGSERSFESVGPTIGKELRTKSIYAVLIVLGILIVYLAHTFKTVGGFISPWKLGLAAIYALVHDLFLVTAFFSVFGKLWDIPVDTLFVTAQLAILGYSVNDTIVIFDRLRSEWIASRGKSLLETLDRALVLTLGRSLNASFTVLITLVAVLAFGGSSIRWFIVALTIGVITGVYSSLFVAPPLLYYLAKRK